MQSLNSRSLKGNTKGFWGMDFNLNDSPIFQQYVEPKLNLYIPGLGTLWGQESAMVDHFTLKGPDEGPKNPNDPARSGAQPSAPAPAPAAAPAATLTPQAPSQTVTLPSAGIPGPVGVKTMEEKSSTSAKIFFSVLLLMKIFL